jgi:hypothetical protein
MSLISNDIKYCVLIKTKAKFRKFSQHPLTVVKYTQKKGKRNFIKNRIGVKAD